MTPEEHRERHKKLHTALDELMADMIWETRNDPEPMLPSKTTVLELMEWAYKQAQNPTEPSP